SGIVEQADRLERMVADLLELSRLRTGAYAARRELNTAEDVVGAALRRARGILNDRTIVPHIDLDAPALVGEFDFVDTLRILGNLLDNALRHSPRGGTVDLYVTRHDRWLEFIVADRGAGVDPLERERIFESFYRPCAARDESGHAPCLIRPRAVSRQDITSDAGELVMRKGMHLLTALTLTAGSITAAACGKGHDNSASSAGGEVSNAPTTTPAAT